MRQNFVLGLGKIFLLISLLVLATGSVVACACNTEYPWQIQDDCAETQQAVCDYTQGNLNGNCECIPDCSCGDAICSDYDIFMEDGNRYCAESTPGDYTYCAADCDPAAISCGNEIVEPEFGEECDKGSNNGEDVSAPKWSLLGSYNEYCSSNCKNLIKVYGPKCGDGNVDYPAEWCDGTNFTGNSGLQKTCLSESSPTQASGKLFCSSDCHMITSSCYAECGNKVIETEFGEECDNGDRLDGDGCSSTCKSEFCGDAICQASEEEAGDCFMDCASGWTTTNNAWRQTPENHLTTTVADASGIVNGVFSNPFDLQLGKTYSLRYKISAPSGCTVYINLNEGKCISGTDFIEKKCFEDISSTLTPFEGTGLGILTEKGVNIVMPAESDDALDGYFKGAKISIYTATNSCKDLIVADISLTETTEISYTDVLDYAVNLTGCCPKGFCWNGDLCVNSSLSMGNSQLPPIWNNVLPSLAWPKNHLNTSNISSAKGFRCVITDDVTREADWVASNIKYDWNYTASGYCARETDCFVGVTYANYVDVVDKVLHENYSDGCIRDGNVISDDFILGTGNHYCHEGAWTTKSYLVATQLETISVSRGKPFVLQCHDKYTLNYNDLPVSATNILSSCVIVIQDSEEEEQIITGVVLDGEPGDATDESSIPSTFLTSLIRAHFENSAFTSRHTTPAVTSIADCVATENENVLECVSVSKSANRMGLYVYYNTKYNYFLISDKSISGLTEEGFFKKILLFFQKIFASRSAGTVLPIYDAINFTTNYDKIYLMRSPNVNVTSIEEMRYDEANQSMVNIFYILYNGTTDATNPIDRDVLFDKVYKTMKDTGKTYIDVQMHKYTNTDMVTQELIIKTSAPSGIWPYLTSILRTRP